MLLLWGCFFSVKLGLMNHRHSVLLIHGIFRQKYVFDRMSDRLSFMGWDVHRFNLKPSNAMVGLDRLAIQVADYIDSHFSPHQSIDLVGYSMGGLICRYYLQRLGGIDRVKNFVTISTPHYGTQMAYVLPFVGYQQMRPNSHFLQDLNQDVEVLNRLNFTSIWTPYDLIIIPASSSQLGIGKDIKIPIQAHFLMVTDNRAIESVVEALK